MSNIREPLVTDASTSANVVIDSTAVEEGIQWVRDMAGEYDFCIVFPAENGDFTKKGTQYCKMLRKLGFELFGYKW